ncbi:uncharacterized protein LOC123321517 isoform X1 [Coccinella septempunctata]|uniref:uncharacterized protein LOC123321517 isoform X1 n=1 Tax=Coccinella septempunctata TaxID=41139 RepID=UPI001D07C65A|nr:uncharacterized protein LOC123321517 isoform X1 [Coccinella septempunctata]
MLIIPESTDQFQLHRLDRHNTFYIRWKKMVEHSKSRKLEVTDVYHVRNSNSVAMYKEARKSKRSLYPNFKEELLLHGTQLQNVESICTHNLDPSFCVSRQYGDVVYLTSSSAHASSFPSPIVPDTHRIMFGCKVLIGNPLDIDRTPKERWQAIPSDCDTKVKQFVGDNGVVNFENGIVAKWQMEDILAEFLIVYKVIQ